MTDLGRAEVRNGCAVVTGFLRGGDGWSSGVQSLPAAAPCQPAAGLEDTGNFVLDDINGDGRTDLHHISRVGLGASATTQVATLLNEGDLNFHPWRRPSAEPLLAVAGPESWAWQRVDADADGFDELVRAEPGMLRILRYATTGDRVRSVDNGQGASTTVTYGTVPEARSYLPAGMLPSVVARIAVTDRAYDPPMQAEAHFTYGGALWSPQHHNLAGFAEIRAYRGEATTVTVNDLGDACRARPTSTTIEHPDGGVMRRTTTTFAETGATAPYTCRQASTTTAECQRTTPCLEKTDVYSYDAYGNVELVEESSGALKRRISTRVHANTADYILDRPYERTTLVPDPAAHGSWVTEAEVHYGYDHRSWELPPEHQGVLTSVTETTNLKTGAVARTTYDYDAVGNRTASHNPSGKETTAIFDPDRSLFRIRDCDATACSGTMWDERLGVTNSVFDVNLQTTLTGHDAYGRPTTTTNPDGSTRTTRYLDVGTVAGPDTGRQRIRTEISDGSPDDHVHWHEDLLDGLGRTYRTRDEGVTSDAADVLITETTYAGPSARPAASSPPRTVREAARWTTYTYDALHRPLELTHPGSPASRTSHAYSTNTVEERDELGRLIVRQHDGFGRTVNVDEHVRPCPTCDFEIQRTSYTYDGSDRLLTVTNAAGMVTTIVRDAAGRETFVTDPDRGLLKMSWGPDGNLEFESDANGAHSWTYDKLGRPETRTDSNTATDTTEARWSYDKDPATGLRQGFSIRRPTLVTYSKAGVVSGSDRFWYDNMGRISQDQHCVDTVCQKMRYAYDAAGRLEYLTYPEPGNPDGESVRHTYDPAGRLTSVGGYVTGIEHDATGATIRQTYGNGLHDERTYDPDRGWLDSQSLAINPKQTNPVFAVSYRHDADARVSSAATTNPSIGGPQSTNETFHYDDLGRLDTYNTNDPASLLPLKFAYDELGRITSSPTGGTYHYDDPAHPHAVTSTSAGHVRLYNPDGNVRKLLDPGGRHIDMDWTPNGMPETINTNSGQTTMAYNADNQRVRRTTGAGVTYYLGRYLEQSNAGLIRYYWAGDQLLARRDPSGKVSYPLQDRLGSTRVVTDSTGAVSARYNYRPYGAEHPGNQSDDTSQRWLGQRSDEDAGLVYLNARFYDPELGAFTAPDSLIPDAYRPQTLNRYAFGEGDPVNNADPSGHISMRVELKKEQDARSYTAYWMYHQQNAGCGGPFVECTEYTPGSFPGNVIWGHWKITYANGEVKNKQGVKFGGSAGSDASEWAQWPGAPSGSDLSEWAQWPKLSAPPLISAPVTKKKRAGNPSEWAQWPTLTPPPLISAPPSENSSEMSAFNPELFLWGSFNPPGLHLGPAEFLQEGVGVAGVNFVGPYFGYIHAVGVEVGKHDSLHGAGYVGVEKIWQFYWDKGGYETFVYPSGLVEVGADGFVGGVYGRQLTSEGSGLYYGLSSEHYAAGMGTNFDWLSVVSQLPAARLGTMLPVFH